MGASTKRRSTGHHAPENSEEAALTHGRVPLGARLTSRAWEANSKCHSL